MNDRSLQGLLGFLDWMAQKGLMPKNTAFGRKAASSKVLGVLDPEELSDVTQVDIEEAMKRFANLQGKNYHPNSIAVYRSRVTAAISDFERWLSDPASFKPGGIQRRSGKTAPPKEQSRPSTSPP